MRERFLLLFLLFLFIPYCQVANKGHDGTDGQGGGGHLHTAIVNGHGGKVALAIWGVGPGDPRG